MRHYNELWLLLAISFVFFFVLSIFDGIALSDTFELRTAGFAEAVCPHRAEPELPSVPAPEAIRNATPAPTDTSAQTILFIGDSMLDGLSPRMAKYCLRNGHRLVSVRWYSSSTHKWANSTRLRTLMESHRPTYVFICLGANELSISNVEAKRGPDIDRILREVGQTPYVWIGPPNWKPDTGINALIARKTAPGTFFLSDGMSFERRKDGAHPTNTSAALWLDSVMRWMPAHAAHPIRMTPPDGELPAKKPSQIIVKLIQPNED